MELITKEDLISFKQDLIIELKDIISKNKTTEESQYLTTLEARKMLRVSVNSLVKIRNKFGLTRIQILGKYYYLRSEIENLLVNGKKSK